MWWRDVNAQPAPCGACTTGDCRHVDPTAVVAEDAVLDTSGGPIVVGARSRICAGATIIGPATIGADCLIGNLALVRGPVTIGGHGRIGFATEIKNALIGEGVSVGPQCFVADSKIEDGAYLGAQVRTSNHRLDGRTVEVMIDGERVDSGLDKLGCLIGAGAALGIQVIVLPGRVIAPGTIVGPRITIEKNLSPGRYRLVQQLTAY